jgi:hypothetical protein
MLGLMDHILRSKLPRTHARTFFFLNPVLPTIIKNHGCFMGFAAIYLCAAGVGVRADAPSFSHQ